MNTRTASYQRLQYSPSS